MPRCCCMSPVRGFLMSSWTCFGLDCSHIAHWRFGLQHSDQFPFYLEFPECWKAPCDVQPRILFITQLLACLICRALGSLCRYCFCFLESSCLRRASYTKCSRQCGLRFLATYEVCSLQQTESCIALFFLVNFCLNKNTIYSPRE